MPFIIFNLADHFSDINTKRAANGERQILDKDWSAHLSSYGNSVKQYWIKQIKAGVGIPEDKAKTLLASLNACLKEHKIKMLDPKVALIEA